MVDMSFPKFSFSLESSHFITGTECYHFPGSEGSLYSFFKKISAKYPRLNNDCYSLLVVLSSKKGVSERKKKKAASTGQT